MQQLCRTARGFPAIQPLDSPTAAAALWPSPGNLSASFLESTDFIGESNLCHQQERGWKRGTPSSVSTDAQNNYSTFFMFNTSVH